MVNRKGKDLGKVGLGLEDRKSELRKRGSQKERSNSWGRERAEHEEQRQRLTKQPGKNVPGSRGGGASAIGGSIEGSVRDWWKQEGNRSAIGGSMAEKVTVEIRVNICRNWLSEPLTNWMSHRERGKV